jgi:hypothetical protein
MILGVRWLGSRGTNQKKKKLIITDRLDRATLFPSCKTLPWAIREGKEKSTEFQQFHQSSVEMKSDRTHHTQNLGKAEVKN